MAVAVILSSKHTTHSRGPESVGLWVFVVFFFFFLSEASLLAIFSWSVGIIVWLVERSFVSAEKFGDV